MALTEVFFIFDQALLLFLNEIFTLCFQFFNNRLVCFICKLRQRSDLLKNRLKLTNKLIVELNVVDPVILDILGLLVIHFSFVFLLRNNVRLSHFEIIIN